MIEKEPTNQPTEKERIYERINHRITIQQKLFGELREFPESYKEVIADTYLTLKNVETREALLEKAAAIGMRPVYERRYDLAERKVTARQRAEARLHLKTEIGIKMLSNTLTADMEPDEINTHSFRQALQFSAEMLSILIQTKRYIETTRPSNKYL